jgi:hypothetical protein
MSKAAKVKMRLVYILRVKPSIRPVNREKKNKKKQRVKE